MTRCSCGKWSSDFTSSLPSQSRARGQTDRGRPTRPVVETQRDLPGHPRSAAVESRQGRAAARAAGEGAPHRPDLPARAGPDNSRSFARTTSTPRICAGTWHPGQPWTRPGARPIHSLRRSPPATMCASPIRAILTPRPRASTPNMPGRSRAATVPVRTSSISNGAGRSTTRTSRPTASRSGRGSTTATRATAPPCSAKSRRWTTPSAASASRRRSRRST